MEFNNIIFDFDGVLADSNKIKKDAYFDIFREVGGTKKIIDEILKTNPDDNRYGIISKSLKRLKEEGRVQYEDLELETQKYAKLYAERTEKGQIEAKEIKGATESLKRLKKSGYRLFLHTSTTDNSMRRVAKGRGISVYFDKIYGSSRGKEAEVIKIIIKENKLFPERTISVGDGYSELETAERLGIRFIALANESNDFSERSDLRYVLYSDLTKLLDVINKINKEN
jgi:phosphoglycolate phosphatase-like HAD superfamily hydrolase